MRRFLGLITFFAFLTLPALAQGTPKLELFGGYQYFHWDETGGALNMNGFDTSATFNFDRWVGLTADIGGAYNHSVPNTSPPFVGPDGTAHIYTYMFGPTIYPLGHHRITLFIHGLAGDGRVYLNLPAIPDPPNPDIPTLTLTDTGFTWAAGGGFDLTLTRHIAVRLFQGDYEQTQFFQDFGDPAQKNIRLSAGIVFRLGS